MNVVEEKKNQLHLFHQKNHQHHQILHQKNFLSYQQLIILSLFLFFCVDVLLEVSTDNEVYLIGNKTNYYYRQTNTLKFFFGYLIVIIINIFRNRGDFVNDNVCCLCGMPLDRPVIFS